MKIFQDFFNPRSHFRGPPMSGALSTFEWQNTSNGLMQTKNEKQVETLKVTFQRLFSGFLENVEE